MKFVLIVIKAYFRIASLIMPKMASAQAFQLFQKTSRKKIKPLEKLFYDSSETFVVESAQENIRCYEKGDPHGDVVLLVHGWNSNPGSMSGIGDELVERGYHVISFDLPAHGKTRASHTNLFICKEAMLAVLKRVRTDQPISVIAHSFGTLVSAYALSTSHQKVDKLILLASTGKVSTIFAEFQHTIGLGKKAGEMMIQKSEVILRENIHGISMRKKLNKRNFNAIELFHDVHDKVLPYMNSVEIAEQGNNTKLHTFEKVGHYRMLWNMEIIKSIGRSFEGQATSVEMKVEEVNEF